MYLLELAGTEDAFAAREAAAAASDVSLLAPGLATARGIDWARIRGLAYTRRVSELLGYAAGTVGNARTLFRAAAIDRTGTVAVRARDVRGSTGIDTQHVERELGAMLVERGFAVNLDAPDHELRAVFAAPAGLAMDDRSTTDPAVDDPPAADLSMDDRSAADSSAVDHLASGSEAEENGGADDSEGICALGWLVAESARGFGERAPTEKPFFQPGSMDPLLARALANVVGTGPKKTIVDPMCGTGGILVEAGLLGARVIGLDAQAKMVQGSRTNLAFYLDGADIDAGSDDEGNPGRRFAVLQGDATRVPLRDGAADGVCFDVPYGRQSKVAGDLDGLVAGALAEARRLAPRAVVVGDRSWTDTARNAGWAIESTFERRVHRSLTRHIAVLEPP